MGCRRRRRHRCRRGRFTSHIALRLRRITMPLLAARTRIRCTAHMRISTARDQGVHLANPRLRCADPNRALLLAVRRSNRAHLAQPCHRKRCRDSSRCRRPRLRITRIRRRKLLSGTTRTQTFRAPHRRSCITRCRCRVAARRLPRRCRRRLLASTRRHHRTICLRRGQSRPAAQAVRHHTRNSSNSNRSRATSSWRCASSGSTICRRHRAS